MRILSWRFFILFILTSIIISLTLLFYSVYQYDLGGEIINDELSIFINRYEIVFRNDWNQPFEQTSQSFIKQQAVSFQQKQNCLEIDNQYKFALSEAENSGIFENTISKVFKLKNQHQNQTNKIKYFIAKSDQFQQILFLNNTSSETKKRNQLSECISFDEVEIRDKIHYFVDLNSKIWIISYPHNNIAMIQIYDCVQRKLIKKIIHEPIDNHNNKYMINRILSIGCDKNRQMCNLTLLTYQAKKYVIEITVNQSKYDLDNSYIDYSNDFYHSRIQLGNNSGIDAFKYRFLDPLNSVFKEQFQLILLRNFKKRINEIRTFLKWFNVNVKWMKYYLNSRIKQLKPNNKSLQLFEYDISAIDQANNYILYLKYDIPNIQEGHYASSIVKLGKYLLKTKSPVFHSIQNYDENDIVEVLKQEKTPTLHQFKKLDINNKQVNQYSSEYYYSLYHVYPDNNIHYLGIGQKLLSFYPNDALKKQDYYHVRSKSGGVIFQGSKIKGAYENRPKKSQQVYQKIYIDANQVLKSVYQAHISYKVLYLQIKSNRVELIHGLNGKVMLTHYFNEKEGYYHAGSNLFNNELWIIQHNSELERSYLVKYELYVDRQHPKQIIFVKREYGRIYNSQLSKQEDDLRNVLENFIDNYGSGFIILDIFRCIDQFYYIQIASMNEKDLLIARIHYKRFSNRQPKLNEKYSGSLQQALIVEPKQMVKQEQKIYPFAVVIESISLFPEIGKVIKQKLSWGHYQTSQNMKITKIKKTDQFILLPYQLISHEMQIAQSDDAFYQFDKLQTIYLINQRDIIQKAYQRSIIETKVQSKNSLMLFIGCVVVILLCLSIKVILSRKKIDQSCKINQFKQIQKKENNNNKLILQEIKKNKKKQKKN